MNAAAPSLAGRSPSGAEAARSGIELFAENHWDLAHEALDRAVTQAPKDAELHNYRARALARLGRLEEALTTIECALRINPTNGADLKNRSVQLRRLGRSTEALHSFEIMLERPPGSLEARLARALLLIELDRREACTAGWHAAALIADMYERGLGTPRNLDAAAALRWHYPQPREKPVIKMFLATTY